MNDIIPKETNEKKQWIAPQLIIIDIKNTTNGDNTDWEEDTNGTGIAVTS